MLPFGSHQPPLYRGQSVRENRRQRCLDSPQSLRQILYYLPQAGQREHSLPSTLPRKILYDTTATSQEERSDDEVNSLELPISFMSFGVTWTDHILVYNGMGWAKRRMLFNNFGDRLKEPNIGEHLALPYELVGS